MSGYENTVEINEAKFIRVGLSLNNELKKKRPILHA
jgi:hypothetical protein